MFIYIFIGRKRNGVRPSHFKRGSSNIIRKALQALEGLKLVEKTEYVNKISN